MIKERKFYYQTSILLVLFITFLTCCKKNEDKGLTVKDINGNIYHTIQIGSQTWMVENLKTSKYQNGDSITYAPGNDSWKNITTGACCSYNNNENNVFTFGRLYNWYAVHDSRKISPIGWHVPTESEWQILIDYIGGDSLAGSKLKETGTVHWNSPNTGSTNEFGFTALPGGGRDYEGGFGDLGRIGSWWSNSEVDTNSSILFHLDYYNTGLYVGTGNKGFGFSIRCIKD